MGIYVLIVYGVVAGLFVSKSRIKISQALLPMVFFAIICAISLGQNYTMSFMGNTADLDEYKVSNFLAKFLLPNGKESFTYELFKYYFNTYLWLSIVFVLAYFLSILFEKQLLLRWKGQA